MKKIFAVALSAIMVTTIFSACGAKDTSSITVVSREQGSGTRDAFVELVGVLEKDAEGNKTDKTTVEAVISQKTDVVITTIANDKNAIGYISLGSLSSNVKALKVNGVEATAEKVKSGEYSVSRPFNIATKGNVSKISQDFINFIKSKEGQKVVEDNKYISAYSDAEEFKSNGSSGKIVVAGSSSVTPVMEKLAEAYKALNSGANIEVQQSDSSSGVKAANDGICDIAMVSRELKDSEKETLTPMVIALDGIAVIVNNENKIDTLTTDQIKSIYVGDVTEWDSFE